MTKQETINNIKRLAKQGDVRAQYDLGMMYEQGNRVKKNIKKAIEQFYGRN